MSEWLIWAEFPIHYLQTRRSDRRMNRWQNRQWLPRNAVSLPVSSSVSLSSCGSWTLSTVKPLWKTNRKTLCMRSLPKTDEGLWTQLHADANSTEAWRWRTFHNLRTDWFPIWDFFVSKCKNSNVIPSVLSSWEQCSLRLCAHFHYTTEIEVMQYFTMLWSENNGSQPCPFSPNKIWLSLVENLTKQTLKSGQVWETLDSWISTDAAGEAPGSSH